RETACPPRLRVDGERCDVLSYVREDATATMIGWLARLRSMLPQPDVPARAEEHTVRGLPVVVQNTRPDIETQTVLRRLDEALGMINMYQPWRLAHMRRDLSAILIARYPCRGAFFPEHRVCLTELTFLARTDITAAP